MSKKAGIFGGTFNPPHIGHLFIAKKILEEYGLDQIFFVPSFMPPHKEAGMVLDANYRKEMVKLLIKGETKFILSEYEISKHTTSYSVNTVRYFNTELPGNKFYFIIGSDAFYYIDTWRESQELLKMTDFIVYTRKDFLRDKITHKFSGLKNIFWHDNDLINIASSDIRLRIRQGEDCREETGSAVWEYIQNNKLYK